MAIYTQDMNKRRPAAAVRGARARGQRSQSHHDHR